MLCSHEHALKRLQLTNQNVRNLIETQQIDGTLTKHGFLIDDYAINEYLKED